MMNKTADLERKLAHYEEPLPEMVDGRYEQVNDHRFNDDGICIRCGEDAEEWDAGCVEKMVNDFKELTAWGQAADDVRMEQALYAKEYTGLEAAPCPFCEKDKPCGFHTVIEQLSAELAASRKEIDGLREQLQAAADAELAGEDYGWLGEDDWGDDGEL